MTFVHRQIRVSFTLAQGTFAGTNSDKLTIGSNEGSQGLRISTRIIKAGGPSMGTAEVKIYGMPLSIMKQLSTLGMKIILIPRNTITVEAGDQGSNLTTVFIGNITNAWTDFAAAPDVVMNISAHVLSAAAVEKSDPISINGSSDVAGIMQTLATRMGLSFENSGVTAKLSNQYLYGSSRDMALRVVQAANIDWNGGDNGVLAIWPKNGSRNGAVPLISKETGMIGYPTFTPEGIMVRTQFNPSVGFGQQIKVKSDILSESTWAVFGLSHNLDANVIGGQWQSDIRAYNPKFEPPILPR